jgi:hypothetical protein
MLDDSYEPLTQLRPAGFPPGLLAGIDAGLSLAARDRPQSIEAWRPLLALGAGPRDASTVVMNRPAALLDPVSLPESSQPSAPEAKTPTKSRAGLWMALAGIVLVLLAGGGYYAISLRGPDPEMVKARAAAEQAEAARKEAEQEAIRLRAEAEERHKAEEEAAERRKLEEEKRQKIEAELAEAAKAKAEQEAAARRKEIEAARKAIEFVAGDFDHFGKTLMMIGVTDHADELRLQGVDIVDDPSLRQLAVNALAAQPRHLKCRQTDRLTDGTPLYRCLITPLNARGPLAEVPDSERTDLALALVRIGLVLASCDAPRAYADVEDEARSRAQSLWSRVKVTEYKRRCLR